MATIRSLSLSVTAKTEKFQKGMKAARLGLHKFVSKIPGANLLLNKFSLALGGAAAVIGSTIWVKNTLAAVDATAKFADRIGMTVEGLQTLQHAATLTGVGVSSLQMGLQRMTRRVAEAAQGTGEAKAALKELRLNARELSQMRPEEMFEKIAGAMAKVPAQGDKVRLAMKLFDSEGVAMVNTLKMGEDGLKALNKQLGETGLLFSRADAGRIEEANDAIARLKLTVQAVANLSVSVLAPAIVKVTDALRGWIEGKGNFRDRLFNLLEGIASWVGAFIDGLGRTLAKLDVMVANAMLVTARIQAIGGGGRGQLAVAMSDYAAARYRHDNYKGVSEGLVDFVRGMREVKQVMSTRALEGVRLAADRASILMPSQGALGGSDIWSLSKLAELQKRADAGDQVTAGEQRIVEVLQAIYRDGHRVPAVAR